MKFSDIEARLHAAREQLSSVVRVMVKDRTFEHEGRNVVVLRYGAEVREAGLLPIFQMSAPCSSGYEHNTLAAFNALTPDEWREIADLKEQWQLWIDGKLDDLP